MISCEVYADQVRMPDTVEDYLGSVPTALSGLKVTWGRGGVTEQPATSTCTLTVADIEPDDDFLAVLQVGARLDVYAAGDVTAGTTPGNVAVDGGFESTPIADRITSLGATSYTSDAAAGSRAVLTQPPGGTAQRILVPPAPWSSSPTAWAPVPQVTEGDTWTVDAQVKLGEPSRITAVVSAALFTAPTQKSAAVFASAAVPTAAGYQRVSALGVVPAVAYGWCGLVLDVTFEPWNAAPGSWAAQPGTWSSWGTAQLDEVRVWAPASASRRVLVFTGSVTDLIAQASGTGVSVAVTATDWSATLANLDISDTPWPVQTISTRAKRILSLAGQSVDPVDPAAVTPVIDTIPGAFRVSWQDVDAQQAWALLLGLADSGDAVAWPVCSLTSGFYVWFEDSTQRQAVAMLAWDTGTNLVEITGNTAATRGIVRTACDILQDPANWEQDVSDVITRVNGTWLDQTVDDKGLPAPTQRSYTVSDPVAEAPKSHGGLGYGVRSMSYTTQLVAEEDLIQVANRVLARSRALGWRLAGITWDTDLPKDFTTADTATALTLLDGAKRPGLPLTLTEMPGWTPTGPVASCYVEGGTYTYDDGRWTLAMTLSPSGAASYSATWNDMDPAWRWSDMDPSISWSELWGVTTSVASLRWRQLDKHPWSADTKTWAQYKGTGA